MRYRLDEISGLKVTIMGLGLNGGGLASARFFAGHGAEVTVTDTKSAEHLDSSIQALQDLPIRFVLGRHEVGDFSSADLVIKNPAVPRDSEYLQAASWIETDLTVFCGLTDSPILAVTGTKGKSTTASCIHHIVKAVDPKARLGGNITISPLSFVDDLDETTPVVLELSSWQLADLAGRELLKPQVAVVTNLMRDHLNRYAGMDDYIADKKIIFASQTPDHYTLLNYDDPRVRSFASETEARVRFFSSRELESDCMGGWLERDRGLLREGQDVDTLFEQELQIPGEHNRLNLLCASTAAALFGIDPAVIRRETPRFTGVEHRLELVATRGGVRFYNDSTATIPDATLAAVRSFEGAIRLIAGGTDKNLDFRPFEMVGESIASAYLLEGDASPEIARYLALRCRNVCGPFDSLAAALSEATREATSGQTVLLSPGCTSFGMFQNEFERGRRFKELVAKLPN